MLKQDDQYGYDVASKLAQNIDIADGSIYLVLRRLKQEDYVSSYLEESSGGPPRKYYVITRKGERFLDELIRDWDTLVDNVNGIIASSRNAYGEKVRVAAETTIDINDENGGYEQ